MPFAIDVPEDSLRYLTHPAKRQLKIATESYARAVLREASLLEAAQRSASGNPEVSKLMITDSVRALRISSINRRPPTGIIIIEILSRITTLLVGGGLFTLDKVKQDNMVFYGFILLILAAGTLNTIEILNRRVQ